MDFMILGAIIAVAILAFAFDKIDITGAISGTILALLVWKGCGDEGLLALFLFFIFGTFASAWKTRSKKILNLQQENEGKRGIANVAGNGGVAGILSMLAIFFPEFQSLIILMVTASFATACSDTFSSEFGNIYGQNYYYITNFKPASRGVDGAVSLQGLAFGLVGSVSIAASSRIFHDEQEKIWLLAFSGLSGNLFDSLLGATLQRKKYLNNHHVNFGATLFGSLLYLALSQWIFN